MKVPRMIPRLITFDVTDTLLMTNLERHYTQAAVSHGLPGLDGTQVARTFRTSMKRLEAEHPVYGKHTGLGWEKWWRTVVYDVISEQHAGVNKDKLDNIADSLIECYSTSRCWHKYPGTIELLDSLARRRDLVLGVISNFDERLEAVLDSCGIRSYFAFVLTSYKIGIAKPDPAIFQEALRLASKGLSEPVKPSEAIHIGDRVDNDYKGAHSARWNAILLNRKKANLDDKIVDPRDVFLGLEDLKKHFDVLLGHKNDFAKNCES